MAYNPDKDTKAIEKKALLCLEEFVIDSKVIAPYLAENDKEPCWDGHLYLYFNKLKDQNHFIGRVPVQVKGMEVKGFVTKKFKFPIEVNDLKSYLHEPTVFIVCQEKENSKDRLLFYRLLLPETIKNILQGKSKQQTIKVLMHPFPDSLTDFESLIKVFFGDSKKQLSFADNPTSFTMDDVKKRGITKFSFLAPTAKMDGMEIMKYLSTSPTYIYAKIDKELNIEIPISGGPMTFAFKQDIKKNISVGNRIFFNDYVNEIKEGKMFIIIGNMLTIILPMDDSSNKVNAEMNIKSHSSLLKYSIVMAEFVLALNDTGKLMIGDLELNIENNDKEFIDNCRTNLSKWQALQEVLDKLHVTKDFDLAGITKAQEPLINILIETIGEGNAVKLESKESTLTLAEISNIKLLLWFSANKNGVCILGDFFDHKISIQSQISENEKVEASPYSYLRNEKLWEKIDNIPYDELIPSYIELFSKHKYAYEMANLDLLSILQAYDALENTDKNKSNQLIKTATELNDWLIKNDPSEERYLIHLINYYQIIRRQRNLTEEEKHTLMSHFKDANISPSEKVGICLLLNDENGIEKWFKECSEEERNALQKYPIWKFRIENHLSALQT